MFCWRACCFVRPRRPHYHSSRRWPFDGGLFCSLWEYGVKIGLLVTCPRVKNEVQALAVVHDSRSSPSLLLLLCLFPLVLPISLLVLYFFPSRSSQAADRPVQPSRTPPPITSFAARQPVLNQNISCRADKA